MRAVLYICHGSRVKAGQTAALAFIQKTMQQVDAPIQEACFLELAEPSISQGIARCLERGATEIIAVPFLLLTAGHAKFDIPEAIEKAMIPYPGIPLYYGEPLGVHEGMIDVLINRMNETAPVQNDAAVLIVGRGSSDPAVQSDFKEIVRLFKLKTGLQDVETGFLAACGPSFEEVLTSMASKNPKQLFIIPYLLFTGILMESMERTVRHLQTDSMVHLCPPLGYDPAISMILGERVEQAALRGERIYVSSNDRCVV